MSITSLLGADSYADGNSALVENLFTAYVHAFDRVCLISLSCSDCLM